jgi:hypothetical protein
MMKMGTYGKLGINVGSVGRWVRFTLGVLMTLWVLTDFFGNHSHSLSFYLLLMGSFAAITGVYTLGHIWLGDKLVGKNPVIATLIFVVPVMFLICAPSFDPSLQVGTWLGYRALNHPFLLALLFYVAISFFFQFRSKYGGCEVVSIPNFLFKKNYGSYCVPLLPLDALEKIIVDFRHKGDQPSV